MAANSIGAAWTQVAVFSSVVDANLDRWLGETYRIGLTEFRALTLVSQSPGKELRVKDLAQRVGLNQSSATRLVSRLETKGFARRDVCMDDGRVVFAVITEQGEALMRSARTPFHARINDLLATAPLHFPGVNVRQLGSAFSEIEALLTT